jgi:hypothetical protein
LIIAAVAQGLQALLLLGLGLATLIVGITDDSEDLRGAGLVAVLALVGGAALVAVARGLLGAQGWARAPALVWQLIMIPVGFTTLDDRPDVAYPLLASVALVLVGLFAPGSGAALAEDLAD